MLAMLLLLVGEGDAGSLGKHTMYIIPGEGGTLDIADGANAPRHCLRLRYKGEEEVGPTLPR